MGQHIILEPSRRDSEGGRVEVDGRTWASFCELARLNGYSVTDEVVLTTLDASLFAQALESGSHGTLAAGLLKTPGAMGKLKEVVGLCERGGIIITRRVKT